MRQRMRSERIHLRSDLSISEIAKRLNPIIQGWMNYYGSFRKTALIPVFEYINRKLISWAMRKYKKLKGRQRKATHWLGRLARREPNLFVHWKSGVRPAAGQ